jgi:hypothetical protein
MNSLLSMFGSGGGTSILFQAIGAAMRGESPQTFLKKLANSDPRLKKMNLDDLMGSAQQLAQQQGISLDDVQKQLDSTIGSMMK